MKPHGKCVSFSKNFDFKRQSSNQSRNIGRDATNIAGLVPAIQTCCHKIFEFWLAVGCHTSCGYILGSLPEFCLTPVFAYGLCFFAPLAHVFLFLVTLELRWSHFGGCCVCFFACCSKIVVCDLCFMIFFVYLSFVLVFLRVGPAMSLTFFKKMFYFFVLVVFCSSRLCLTTCPFLFLVILYCSGNVFDLCSCVSRLVNCNLCFFLLLWHCVWTLRFTCVAFLVRCRAFLCSGPLFTALVRMFCVPALCLTFSH